MRRIANITIAGCGLLVVSLLILACGGGGSTAASAPTPTPTPPPAGATTAPDVTTYHFDNARDGLNAAETILTPSNVNSTQFGKIGFDTVDGVVDAQPLYVANLTVNGALHNVLYIATEHDSVYAFDADTGTQLWKTSVLGTGESTSDDHGCGQITPEIGITSTPVIDRHQGADGTLFAVGMSKDGSGNYHQRFHALDLTTGAEISGSPTEISASYPSSGPNSQNGNVVFAAGQYAERAALLLLNGNIYLTWTSHCDAPPFNGWVMSYSETTLKQTQVLNVTPNGEAGAIWMSGDGPAADSSGNIYFLDANGTFDLGFDSSGFPTMGDFGNGIIKLSLNSTGTLVVADFFEPYNTDSESNGDIDLGSGGELLLPDLTDASGKARQLIVGAGKDQHIYLGDRNNLGKFNSMTADNSNLYQDVSGALSGAVSSMPAYFNGVIYYAAVGDTLKAFPLTNAKLAATPSSQSATTFAYPGATPSVSANGNQNGIVWALESNSRSPEVLHAYDATNLGKELYNSSQASGGRDSFGNGNKFMTPMIVNGKVYAGTATGVAIFGLLSQ
jgi:outer membrane protein assembly factor BamB